MNILRFHFVFFYIPEMISFVYCFIYGISFLLYSLPCPKANDTFKPWPFWNGCNWLLQLKNNVHARQ